MPNKSTSEEQLAILRLTKILKVVKRRPTLLYPKMSRKQAIDKILLKRMGIAY